MDNNEYMNLDDALTRIGGNLGLYKKLLVRFVDGNHFDALHNALVAGDLEEALRQAHALKGVSANLSLIKISSLSLELEQKLKENQDFSDCLTELEQAFQATLEKITEITAA